MLCDQHKSNEIVDTQDNLKEDLSNLKVSMHLLMA